jgi:hypothetical protein
MNQVLHVRDSIFLRRKTNCGQVFHFQCFGLALKSKLLAVKLREDRLAPGEVLVLNLFGVECDGAFDRTLALE